MLSSVSTDSDDSGTKNGRSNWFSAIRNSASKRKYLTNNLPVLWGLVPTSFDAEVDLTGASNGWAATRVYRFHRRELRVIPGKHVPRGDNGTQGESIEAKWEIMTNRETSLTDVAPYQSAPACNGQGGGSIARSSITVDDAGRLRWSVHL
jgi:hypothetical protein